MEMESDTPKGNIMVEHKEETSQNFIKTMGAGARLTWTGILDLLSA